MDISFEELSKWKKRSIAFFSDSILTFFAWYNALILTLGLNFKNFPFFLIAKLTLIQCVVYLLCGLYRGLWRFASIPDLIRIIRAVLIGTSVCLIYIFFTLTSINLATCIIYALLTIVLLSGTRISLRYWRDYKPFTQGKRVLIVGAGSAGEGIIRDLCRSASVFHYQPVAIVDDDVTRHGCEMRGIRIIGTCADIPKVAVKYHIDLILIAIPSASSANMRKIVDYCDKSKVPYRTLPSIKDIADGNVAVNIVREVLLEDLLGREPIDLDWQAIKTTLTGQTILVTGGGGSIGSELSAQICRLEPKKLIIVDNNEFNLYSIQMELGKKIEEKKLHVHLCSVIDKVELQKIFLLYQPTIIFHVAAYKHVPLLESHLRVAMQNNILGTRIVAELAEAHHVQTFVLISTDKAVNPTNIMGATKRASELYCQNLNLHSKTNFITVRFGNVLNSAGSVIPLFYKQLAAGGPLTVTHKAITRYFMTIPEASQLILQAATMVNQGDIFILDMGKPIKIDYLAKQIIKLSGKKIDKDIAIQYSGLRPGEKLYEELFYAHEEVCATTHHKIKLAKGQRCNWEQLQHLMHKIEIACQNNDDYALAQLLITLVPEYKKHVLNSLPVMTSDPDYSLSFA